MTAKCFALIENPCAQPLAQSLSHVCTKTCLNTHMETTPNFGWGLSSLPVHFKKIKYGDGSVWEGYWTRITEENTDLSRVKEELDKLQTEETEYQQRYRGSVRKTIYDDGTYQHRQQQIPKLQNEIKRKSVESEVPHGSMRVTWPSGIVEEHLYNQGRLVHTHEIPQALKESLKELAHTKQLQEQLEEEKHKTEQEKEKHLCQVCMDCNRNALMMPCMHFMFCHACVSKIADNKCPACRTPISGVLQCKLNV